MLAPPRNVQLGFDHLVGAVGGVRAAARACGVSVRTVQRWLQRGAPYAPAALLWWHSHHGQTAIALDAGRRIEMMRWQLEAERSRVRELRDQVGRLARLVAAVAPSANDAVRAG
jgi:hypothetical protein